MFQSYLAYVERTQLDKMVIPGSQGTSILLPIRGYKIIPDSNPDPTLIEDKMMKVYQTLGGASYHKKDRLGRPIFIDRPVRFNFPYF